MDVFSFIDSMTGRLAWPLAIMGIALLYRRPIVRLIGAITKLKVGDAEFEFSKDVALAAILAPKESASVELPLEIKNILEINPRIAIHEAFVLLESELMHKSLDLGMAVTGSKTRPKDVILRLFQTQKIRESEVELFNKLQELRNTAAHGGAFSWTIDKTDASMYVHMAFSLSQKIRKLS